MLIYAAIFFKRYWRTVAGRRLICKSIVGKISPKLREKLSRKLRMLIREIGSYYHCNCQSRTDERSEIQLTGRWYGIKGCHFSHCNLKKSWLIDKDAEFEWANTRSQGVIVQELVSVILAVCQLLSATGLPIRRWRRTNKPECEEPGSDQEGNLSFRLRSGRSDWKLVGFVTNLKLVGFVGFVTKLQTPWSGWRPRPV